MRLELTQQTSDDGGGQTGHDMLQYEQVSIEVGLFDFDEAVLDVLDAVDGAVDEDFMLSHQL